MHNRWVIALLLAVCGCGGGGGGGDQGGASCPLSAALVASAGSDRTAPTHTLVQLDGSDSIVKSGKAVLFEWTLSSRPQGSAAALSSTADARPSFTPDRNGAFVLSLVVTDGRSCSAQDTLTVVAENFAPVVNAGAARTVNLPTRSCSSGPSRRRPTARHHPSPTRAPQLRRSHPTWRANTCCSSARATARLRPSDRSS